MSLLPYLHRVVAGESLDAADARSALLSILDGESSTAQIAAFLVALKMKGETAAELTGFARAMREKVVRVETGLDPSSLLDTCGTGGDGVSTFNISTIAAFVTAGAGVPVAKHGNRSISSLCGSADLLEALGVPILDDPARIARAIREIGIGFLFAPAHHPAGRHVQPARLELKMRTVFNLLGPLVNPAGAGRQLIGAPSLSAARLMAETIAALGADFAFVVHGSDGMDEITTTGSTAVFEVQHGAVVERVWMPEDFGVKRTTLSSLISLDRQRNLEIAGEVLAGGSGPARDIVLVNAAAALLAAGAADSPLQAMRLAADSLSSGAARAKLDALRGFARTA